MQRATFTLNDKNTKTKSSLVHLPGDVDTSLVLGTSVSSLLIKCIRNGVPIKELKKFQIHRLYLKQPFFLLRFPEKQKKFFSNVIKPKNRTNGVLKYERSECFKLAMSNGFNGFFEFEMNFFYFLVKSRQECCFSTLYGKEVD